MRIYRVAFAGDGETLRWAEDSAPEFDAAATTETYRAVPVRPGVFMVSWREADGTTVTHVEDFENDAVHAALPDHTFLTPEGRWVRLD